MISGFFKCSTSRKRRSRPGICRTPWTPIIQKFFKRKYFFNGSHSKKDKKWIREVHIPNNYMLTSWWTPPCPWCLRPPWCSTCPWGTWNQLQSIPRQKLWHNYSSSKTMLKWFRTWRRIITSTTWWTPPCPWCRRPQWCQTCPTWNLLQSISRQKLDRNDV